MEFQERLQLVFKETPIEILEYNGEKGKLIYRCKQCGTVYTVACARNAFSKISLCKKCFDPFGRWNAERFLEYKLNRLFPDSKLEVIEFRNLRKGGKIKCLKCGEIEDIVNFEAMCAARKGDFCKNCEKDEKNKVYTHVLSEVEKGFIKMLEWNGVNNKSKFQCTRCGHIFARTVSSNFDGEYCPNCHKVSNKFSFEEAQEKLNEIGKGEYTLLQYNGTNGRSLVKHKCGFCFTIRLADFEKTRGCPKCYGKVSKLEQQVEEWLKNNNYIYLKQVRFPDLPRQSFDFAVKIKGIDILIEVQGRQHYENVEVFDDYEIQKERDNKKREFCLVNNIPLIEIPYWEIKNLDNFLPLKFNDYLI